MHAAIVITEAFTCTVDNSSVLAAGMPADTFHSAIRSQWVQTTTDRAGPLALRALIDHALANGQ